MFIQNFDSFPIHSLPLITQGAVIDAYTVTGVPAVLAAGAVLSAAAVAPDGHPNSPAYGHLKLPHLN